MMDDCGVGYRLRYSGRWLKVAPCEKISICGCE